MTPQEIRNLRLKNDYEEMVNIKGEIINWKAIRGNPPFIEEYELTINIKGIISNTPAYRYEHIVRVVLPSGYPNTAPDMRLVSVPNLFHPNWHRDGKWCFGTWLISEGLGHHVIRMIRTIQYDMEITNEKSPANTDANKWYESRKNSGLFPCDKKQLPDPSHKRFEINPEVKKKFEIKSK